MSQPTCSEHFAVEKALDDVDKEKLSNQRKIAEDLTKAIKLCDKVSSPKELSAIQYDENKESENKPRLSHDSGCDAPQESTATTPEVFIGPTISGNSTSDNISKLSTDCQMKKSSSVEVPDIRSNTFQIKDSIDCYEPTESDSLLDKNNSYADINNGSLSKEQIKLQNRNDEFDSSSDLENDSKTSLLNKASVSEVAVFQKESNDNKNNSPNIRRVKSKSSCKGMVLDNEKQNKQRLSSEDSFYLRSRSSSVQLPLNQCTTSDYSSLSSNNSSRTSESGNSPCSYSINEKRNSYSNISNSSNKTIRDNVSDTSEGSKTLSVKIDKLSSSASPSKVSLIETSSHNPANSVTPTGSCLKAGPRGISTVHVQFDTSNSDDGSNPRETLVSSDGTVILHEDKSLIDPITKLWSRLHHEAPANDSSLSNLKGKKNRRHPSGSSNVSFGSTSSSESAVTEFERQAPDGGWGWVIVFASFLVHCIADGVTMSFGVLFVEFLDYFQESKSLTSWIGSLFMAIPLLAGPVASILTDRYGCKAVTIWGAIISCLGFFVSAFANSITVLLITVGVITGLGLAVCYVAAIVIVAFYFEKKRSLATGIAVAGSGIGTFLFAPLIQYLLEQWGWRGCLVILAGIFLNMAVCGSVMRDLEWTRKKPSKKGQSSIFSTSRRGSASQSSDTLEGHGAGNNSTLPSVDELRRLVQSGDVAALLSPDDHPHDSMRGSASLVQLPTFLSNAHSLPPDLLPCLSSRTNAYEIVSQMYPYLLTRSFSGCLSQADAQQQDIPQTKMASELHIRCKDNVVSKMSDKDPNKEQQPLISHENKEIKAISKVLFLNFSFIPKNKEYFFYMK